jgi:hypothetical protein
MTIDGSVKVIVIQGSCVHQTCLLPAALKLSARMPRKSLVASLDIVFAGDMAGSADCCLRIAGEATVVHKAGYRVGMLHIASSVDEIVPISPEIRSCVHGTSIEILDPEQATRAKLLVLHPPLDGSTIRQCVTLLQAPRVVVVPDDIEELTGENAAEDLVAMSHVSVAPTTPAMRERLVQHSKFRLEPKDWLPLVETAVKSRVAKSDSQLRLGFIIRADSPEAVRAIREMIKGHTSLETYIWHDRGRARQRPQTVANCKMLDGAETSMAWFLRRIGALVLIHRPERPELPAAIVAAAQGAGKPVLVPSSPEPPDRLPAGVLMVDPSEMIATARRLLSSPCVRSRRKDRVEPESSAKQFLKRLRILAGAARPPARKTGIPGRQKPRVLFLPKGGVGLGHVARLLAIARRAGNSFDPVIVSLSETAGLIEALGFRAEYIPSAAYAGIRPVDWNPWFQYELEQLIDAYEARAVVFDGSDPPAALGQALASRAWCRGVWIRRGMWAQGFDPSLQHSGDYDLIIEPGELAAVRDRGATVARRREALQVDPITLLDPPELLSREAAAAAVGLDPQRPAALIQLGSGENRNILNLLDKIVAECRRHPDLQVAIAQWANTTVPLNLWPGVKILNGAPLSLYYRAFDFSISATGYNSFHEVISFGLPTLFVPNLAPGMDDQAARSGFAQDGGAAIELRDHEFHDLPTIVDLLMQPAFRSVMQVNCGQLTRKNGATAASRAIGELVS